MHLTTNIISNSNQSCTFSSRSQTIRKLDGIYRDIRKNIPVYSNTQIESVRLSKNEHILKVYRYTSDLLIELRGFARKSDTNLEYVYKILSGMKHLHIGNCAEQSIVTALACRFHGYKDAKVVQLCAIDKNTKGVRSLPHTAVAINFNKVDKKNILYSDKKSLIVDTWGGFADFSKNAEVAYRYDPKYALGIKPTEDFCYRSKGSVNGLNEADMNYLKEHFPYLAPKKERFIDKLFKFMGFDKLKKKFSKPEEPRFKEFPLYLKENFKRIQRFKSALSDDEFMVLINRSIEQ